MLTFITTALLILIATLVGIVIWYFSFFSKDPSYIAEYAKRGINSKDVSLVIKRNNTTLLSINPHAVIPLASTVKIIIALEYAHQVRHGSITEDDTVSKETLDKFYVKDTDGGAHQSWLESHNFKSVYTLKEVVIGMMAYSSNANTDYLIKLLGSENINEVPARLELKQHSAVYPIVSALYVPNYIKHKEQLDSNERVNRLVSMSQEEYMKLCYSIQQDMMDGADQPYLQEEVDLDLPLQKNWSDRLPSSSASDYLRIMELINSRTFFDSNMQICIEEVMGHTIMRNEKNRSWLKYAGYKGGSTHYIHTCAAFATDLQGNKTEIVFLSNQLDDFSRKKLNVNLNQFILKVLSDAHFRKKLSLMATIV
ncbi:serine hydrolase [Rossellomorea aquimaris]|uniref:serine hydrolase n=1 Tax=Rossellomorea aquimaris TaxID=189382 RepID=UPI0037C9C48A